MLPLPSVSGTAIQISAAAPGTASICAAGPARVCHSSIRHANSVNSATAAQPTMLGARSSIARFAATNAPSRPISGKVTIGNAVRNGCV